jgi:hypothetical protein
MLDPSELMMCACMHACVREVLDGPIHEDEQWIGDSIHPGATQYRTAVQYFAALRYLVMLHTRGTW